MSVSNNWAAGPGCRWSRGSTRSRRRRPRSPRRSRAPARPSASSRSAQCSSWAGSSREAGHRVSAHAHVPHRRGYAGAAADGTTSSLVHAARGIADARAVVGRAHDQHDRAPRAAAYTTTAPTPRRRRLRRPLRRVRSPRRTRRCAVYCRTLRRPSRPVKPNRPRLHPVGRRGASRRFPRIRAGLQWRRRRSDRGGGDGADVRAAPAVPAWWGGRRSGV